MQKEDYGKCLIRVREFPCYENDATSEIHRWLLLIIQKWIQIIDNEFLNLIEQSDKVQQIFKYDIICMYRVHIMWNEKCVLGLAFGENIHFV